MEVNEKITNLLLSHLQGKNGDNSIIINALYTLLNGHYVKYDFNDNFATLSGKVTDDNAFQKILSTLNEKTAKRKVNGVYYTPKDVVEYIIYNTVIMNVLPELSKTFKKADAENLLFKLDEMVLNTLLFKKTFIDPTCGSGEFLISVFELKMSLLSHFNLLSDTNLLLICKTIFGNDIDEDSTDICKIRLFFAVAKFLKNETSLDKLATILKAQFYNEDFVLFKGLENKSFDIIVGNPPYVEYGQFKGKENLANNFGNIYADVIKNSITILKPNGSFGFITPLSYTATARMGCIRQYIKDNTYKQYILNFADRPDCLFQGVHQKLNIIIANKGKNKEQEIYTSSYKHWYKEERSQLLNGCEIIRAKENYIEFIPKIGNELEQSIFNKVVSVDGHSLYSLQSKMDSEPIYLNMRACFWIKAFTFNPGSNEYKAFYYYKDLKSFFFCILNSSLFWLYWTIVSDCWHITSKELKGFAVSKLPSKLQITNFDKLLKNLETKLEETKKYIGSKQTEYEYKHKDCKAEIDAIDDALVSIFEFTKDELTYIKNFAKKYRMGGENE
ncbi:MAG: SAM-dependent methyltransferase [Clostridiales bacterium]|jgi:hypothetical protein|nr:SAM-dependent methyltransferase [Clostridiales bacterium]